MKEQLKAKCLQLTEQILQEYYFRQPGRLFTHLDGEVVWIGAAAGQYVRGADKVRQYILGIVETMPKVCLLSAYTEEMMRTWHLGTIYGYDGERMKLHGRDVPLLRKSR